MSNKRYRFGLIGWPVDHSLSPQIHLAAMAALGLEGEYRLYPVPPLPAGGAILAKLMEALRSGRMDGLNVTIPHKQHILSSLDCLTPAAQAIGAVNTLYARDGSLHGDNTDGEGFLSELRSQLSIQAGRALILGSGGAARAAAYILHREGWEICIAARGQAKGRLIARDLSVSGRPPIVVIGLDSHSLASNAVEGSLIVNATSVGMEPMGEASLWPADVSLPSRAVVFDLVYRPQETALVRTAKAAGLVAMTGQGMLVEQAALALERWTGQTAPREAMRRAIQDSMSEPR